MGQGVEHPHDFGGSVLQRTGNGDAGVVTVEICACLSESIMSQSENIEECPFTMSDHSDRFYSD
jgi:hypothetical protein